MVQLPSKYNYICNEYGRPIDAIRGRELTASLNWFRKYMVLYQLTVGGMKKERWVNKAIIGLLDKTIDYLPDGFIKQFGCYNVRLKRTSNEPSVHSWGLAVDINWKHNPMTKKDNRRIETHDEAFTLQMFKDLTKLGWHCGYYFSNVCDRMHLQLKGLGV